AILAQHRRVLRNIRDNRWGCRDQHRRPDEAGNVVEYLRPGDAIGVAAFHRDLDCDYAVRADPDPAIRQVDLVGLRSGGAREEGDERREQRGYHEGVPASSSRTARCRAASFGTIANMSLCWIRA